MPTYITLKDVKKRWGSGQDDVFPVTQFEKLWSDMTRHDELDCRFLLVDRPRGRCPTDLSLYAHPIGVENYPDVVPQIFLKRTMDSLQGACR